ncbi:MAG TPA: hypothetical protein VK694_06255 [Verrucomicrobiae bacterium]|nr:hypothetical protein [Verrucomicrobiae bacterium]
MTLQYFAHNGVEHATPAEATAHSGSATPLFLFVLTILVVGVGALVIYLLSAPGQTRSASAKKQPNKQRKPKEA